MGLASHKVINLDSELKPVGVMQQITVDATAGGKQIATPIPEGASHALVGIDGDAARVTFDGSAPTSTNGHLLANGYSAVWSAARIAAAKFIRVTGNATLHVSFFTV